MILNLPEVARAIQAAGEMPPLPVTGWSVDTRTQNAGDLYFALRGPNHDGHDYVAAAFGKAAVGVVVEPGRGVPAGGRFRPRPLGAGWKWRIRCGRCRDWAAGRAAIGAARWWA